MPKISGLSAHAYVGDENGWMDTVTAEVSLEEEGDNPTPLRKKAIELLLLQLKEKLEAILLPGE